MLKLLSEVLRILTCRRKAPKPSQQELIKNLEKNSIEFLQAVEKSKKLRNVSQDHQLLLYALYKQAIFGDCKLSEPMRLDFEKHAKWVAWTAVKGISVNEAESQYQRVVNQLYSQQPTRPDDDENDDDIWVKEDENKPERKMGMGAKVSTIQSSEFDTNEAFRDRVNKNNENQKVEGVELNDKERELLQKLEAQISYPQQLKKSLEELTPDIRSKVLFGENEQNVTLLHCAIDKENVDAFDVLAQYYQGNIDVQESVSGMTPLHYACMSGNEELITRLIRLGADPKVKDFSDKDAFENIEKSLKHLLQA